MTFFDDPGDTEMASVDDTLMEFCRGVIHVFLRTLPQEVLRSVDSDVVCALIEDAVERATDALADEEILGEAQMEEMRTVVADEVLQGLLGLYVGKVEAA